MKISSRIYLRRWKRYSEQGADRAKHDDDEYNDEHVEGEDEVGQREQHGCPIRADRVGHRAEGTDGRQAHDDVNELEECRRDRIEAVLDRNPLLRFKRHQAKAENNRNHEHLEQLAARESSDEVVGKDVEQKLIEGDMGGGGGLCRSFRRLCRRLRCDDVAHVLSDADEIAEYQPECQRNRRQDLEIDHRDETDLAHSLDVAGSDDADGNGQKNQWRDGGLDQAQEDVAENLEGSGEVGPDQPDDDPQHHADHDLESEVLPERSLGRRGRMNICKIRLGGCCRGHPMSSCHVVPPCLPEMRDDFEMSLVRR